MLRTAREAWALITPQRRRRFVQVGLLSLVVSGMEMAAALAIAVLLGLVLAPGSVPEFPIIGDVRDLLPGASYEELVLWTCGAFAVLFLVRAALFLLQQYAVARVSENTAVQLSDRLVDGYLSMPYEWHLQRSSATLVHNAWDNVQRVKGGVFTPLANVVAEGVLVVVMLAFLLATSVSITAVAGGVLGLSLLVTMALVQPRLKRLGSARNQSARRAMQDLQEGFGGIRDLKVLGREAAFARAFRAARGQMARSDYGRAALTNVPRVLLELSFLGLLLMGVAFAVLRGEVESILATLGLFAYVGLRLQPSLQKISMAMNNLRYAEAPVTDLRQGLELLDESRSARDQADADIPAFGLAEELHLDDVSYRYPGADDLALRDVDIRVRKGDSLGIVGATGSGKSTLLDVICALLEPTTGRVLVDGQTITGRERGWQRSIGVVHQSAFLTDDTVRRNVALGVPEDDIDEERLVWAVRAAQLDEVVAELPRALDTVLGERGVRLSGGERQRVTVARALYAEPDVLLLDEGTASLDNATERRLMRALAAVEDLTTVTVAHRLSTVADCDEIIVLDAGRLVARGTYRELLQSSDTFRELADTTGV